MIIGSEYMYQAQKNQQMEMKKAEVKKEYQASGGSANELQEFKCYKSKESGHEARKILGHTY